MQQRRRSDERIELKKLTKMQIITKILILSLLSSGLFAQEYARGYNQDRLLQVKNQLDANCVGDPEYCECIYEKVVSQVAFKDMRNPKPEVFSKLVEITKSCPRCR